MSNQPLRSRSLENFARMKDENEENSSQFLVPMSFMSERNIRCDSLTSSRKFFFSSSNSLLKVFKPSPLNDDVDDEMKANQALSDGAGGRESEKRMLNDK